MNKYVAKIPDRVTVTTRSLVLPMFAQITIFITSTPQAPFPAICALSDESGLNVRPVRRAAVLKNHALAGLVEFEMIHKLIKRPHRRLAVRAYRRPVDCHHSIDLYVLKEIRLSEGQAHPTLHSRALIKNKNCVHDSDSERTNNYLCCMTGRHGRERTCMKVLPVRFAPKVLDTS
jgi:hypothetical protein